MSNFDPLLWPHRTPGGHDLNKLESPLYQEASIKISAFLAQWFLRRRFLKIINFSFYGPVFLEKNISKYFPYIIICKTLIPYRGHNRGSKFDM